jgi:hypothetical protein
MRPQSRDGWSTDMMAIAVVFLVTLYQVGRKVVKTHGLRHLRHPRSATAVDHVSTAEYG